jgi:signal peptide peptidase SppA
MKKSVLLVFALAAALAACSPRISLDLLGEDKLREVVLLPGPARDKVLMIDIDGTISAALETGFLSREKSVVARVFERLERAAADPSVKALILRLDTPGGEVTASDIIYHEILRFKERTGRPVVGLMMSVAASGGYYIASACDLIIAHPSTLTGSIGVISVFPSVESLMAKVGVKVNVIKSGPAKDSGSPFRDMTEDEKRIFQGIIDEYYENFLAVVARDHRGRPRLYGPAGPEAGPHRRYRLLRGRLRQGPGHGRHRERQARGLHLLPQDEDERVRGPAGRLLSRGREGPRGDRRRVEDGLLLSLAAAGALKRTPAKSGGRSRTGAAGSCAP